MSFLSKGFFITCIFFLALSGYGQNCDSQPNSDSNFEDIKTILDSHSCNSCHNGTTQSWTYDTYENLFIKSICGDPIIVRKDASKSVLYDKINGNASHCGESMPPSGPGLSTSEITRIEQWINFGAPEYCVNFYDDIVSLLDNNDCNQCHYKNNGDELWIYSDVTEIYVNGAQSLCDVPIIFDNQAEESLLYQKISNTSICGDAMPQTGNPMSSKDISIIRDWINVGSPISKSLLPVHISEFGVSNVEGGVDVFWTTQSEINTSYFDIEVSTDGLNFDIHSKKTALGSQDGAHSYSQRINLLENNVYYFRIKAVDFDGKFDFSIIRQAIINNDESNFEVFPSILKSNESININWSSNLNQYSIQCTIIDAFGNIHLEKIISQGKNRITLPQLASGLYYVQVVEYSEMLHYKRIFVLE